MALNTPAQSAAIVTDYILTIHARFQLMNAEERKALATHLKKTALTDEQITALLNAFDL